MSHNSQPARGANIKAIVDYFTSGIKDKAERIGIELENTLVYKDGSAVCYNDKFGQEWLLRDLHADFPNPIKDASGDLVGVAAGMHTVTLEPAAQVELSTGPFDTLAKASTAFADFRQLLDSKIGDKDIDVVTLGYHPTARAIDLPIIPKKRYDIMNKYLGAISMFGICMMRGSASTQVAIDYTSIEDCLRKLRLANACVPVFSLICDNSPIFEGKIRPHQLMRTEIWEKCDPDRCNTVPGVMEDGFTLEDYAEYILDTPAMVDISTGTQVLSEKSFGDLYADKEMGISDVEHALSMLFTDIRLKKYIEIRPADAMPTQYVIAYAALIKGLFYNEESLCALDSLFKGISADDIANAKLSLMANGYNGTIFGSPASEIADQIISIAATGLSDEESPLIIPLAELVASRTTLAEQYLTNAQQNA